MWREADPTGQRGWRGSIHDVTTGRRHYVTAPVEVGDFIDVTLRRDPGPRAAETPAIPENPEDVS